MSKYIQASLLLAFLVSIVCSQEPSKEKSGNEIVYSESTVFEIKLAKPNSKNRKAKKKKSRKKNRKKGPKLRKRDEAWLNKEPVNSRDAELITVPVTVYDAKGSQIRGLDKNEFKVFENGVEQKIQFYGKINESNTIIFVLDLSPSAAARIKQIKNVLNTVIQKAKRFDRIMIVGFDSGFKVYSAPTNDKEKLTKAVGKLKLGSGTSVYDAVSYLSSKFIKRIAGRKNVILFSDGVDTASTNSNYIKSITNARESNIVISSVYFDSFNDFVRGNKNKSARVNSRAMELLKRMLGPRFKNLGKGSSKKEYVRGLRYMRQLVFSTGGRMFNAGASELEFAEAFTGAYSALESQEYIQYFSNQPSPSNKGRRIKIRFYRPNMIVHTRSVYF